MAARPGTLDPGGSTVSRRRRRRPDPSLCRVQCQRPTSDEYVRAFHERNPSIPLREVPGKLAAGITTIGLGGAVGLEGPSIYAGSAFGLSVNSRLGAGSSATRPRC